MAPSYVPRALTDPLVQPLEKEH